MKPGVWILAGITTVILGCTVPEGAVVQETPPRTGAPQHKILFIGNSLTYYNDEHPNMHGTYLSTLVVYATVFKANPVGLKYVPSGVAPEIAAYLQKVAWETVHPEGVKGR